MKVDVFNTQGKKTSTVDLPEAIFAAPINVDLMHQAYTRQMANARLGTHETKLRGEVSGGGRKPWRQKGTGRARQGSTRAAQWVGGGRIFTPHNRDYSMQMPRKMRRAALRSALSVKNADAQIVMVDEMVLPEIKTQAMLKVLDALVGKSRALVLLPERSPETDAIITAGRNLKEAKLLFANYLNIRDLLSYEKVIIPLKSLDVIVRNLG